MHDPKEKPENHTRCLVETYDGVLDFAYYVDGKYQMGIHWYSPLSFKGWISISELKKTLNIK